MVRVHGMMVHALCTFSSLAHSTSLQHPQVSHWPSCHVHSLSYPLDVTKTQFKLVVKHNGWEYVVEQYDLGAMPEPETRKLVVTVIEFESVAVVLGNLGIRVSLVAYPVVCVKKVCVDSC